jgi:hypothetical protein
MKSYSFVALRLFYSRLFFGVCAFSLILLPSLRANPQGSACVFSLAATQSRAPYSPREARYPMDGTAARWLTASAPKRRREVASSPLREPGRVESPRSRLSVNAWGCQCARTLTSSRILVQRLSAHAYVPDVGTIPSPDTSDPEKLRRRSYLSVG